MTLFIRNEYSFQKQIKASMSTKTSFQNYISLCKKVQLLFFYLVYTKRACNDVLVSYDKMQILNYENKKFNGVSKYNWKGYINYISCVFL